MNDELRAQLDALTERNFAAGISAKAAQFASTRRGSQLPESQRRYFPGPV